MTPEEREIVEAVAQNSVLFMKQAVVAILKHNDDDDAPLNKQTAILSSSFIQVALELATVARTIMNHGLASIISAKQNTLTLAQMVAEFANNSLKTKTFNELKNTLRADQVISDTDYSLMTQFQSYRNKLLHFAFKFHPDDLYDIKYEFIYLLVHVLPTLLGAEPDTGDLHKRLLPDDQFRMLIRFPRYAEKMSELAKNMSSSVYKCFFCGTRSLAIDEEFCCCCCFDYDDNSFGFANCPFCDCRKAVIFDAGNIDSQRDRRMNGLCLNCDAKCEVYKCPECHEANVVEADASKKACSLGRCQYAELP